MASSSSPAGEPDGPAVGGQDHTSGPEPAVGGVCIPPWETQWRETEMETFRRRSQWHELKEYILTRLTTLARQA
eukprot:3166282-Prorocentrum_lima.AAC.1